MKRQRTVEGIIKRAHQLILEKGWVRHTYNNDWGYCLMGALNEAADTTFANARRSEAILRVTRKIQELYPGGYSHDVVKWNDNDASRKDVLRVLREAAK